MTPTADNCKEAIYILKKRFGNKQQIITKHRDILLNVEAVSSQQNIKGLRYLYDLVESQVRGLKSLGVELTSYGSLLLSVLLQKLPPDLRLILSRETREDDWNLDSLLRQLEEIKACERAMPSSTQPSTALKTGPRNDSTSTAATLLALTNTPSCCFCHQSHPSSGCKTVLDIGERKRILMRSGRCFICLKKYHISKECRSAIRCRNCGGRHHTSICMKNLTETIKPAIQPSTVSQGANPTNQVTQSTNKHVLIHQPSTVSQGANPTNQVTQTTNKHVLIHQPSTVSQGANPTNQVTQTTSKHVLIHQPSTVSQGANPTNQVTQTTNKHVLIHQPSTVSQGANPTNQVTQTTSKHVLIHHNQFHVCWHKFWSAASDYKDADLQPQWITIAFRGQDDIGQ